MQFHNFIFSLPYLLILFCFLTVNFLRCTIHRKYLISGGIFILFFGCRGFVGWDWYSYYEIYNQTSDLIIQKYSTEPCFGFFMVGCKIIGLDYHGFVLVSTCFDFIITIPIPTYKSPTPKIIFIQILCVGILFLYRF